MSLKDRVVRALALRWMRAKVKALRGKEKETMMGKVLKFLDGWKLVLAVVAIAGAKAWDMSNNGHAGDDVGIVLQILGYTPGAEWGTLARDMGAHMLALAAILHKLVKAQQQAKSGATATELLSAPGYAKKYINDALNADGLMDEEK